MSDDEINKINATMLTNIIATLDPDLALIRTYLMYSKINPKIIPIVIDQLNLIAKGSGFGQVIIEIQDNKIMSCRGVNERHINLDINEEENVEISNY